MLLRFGLYLTSKRQNAIWVALVCALLPFLQLPTLWISQVILALVTLHKGPKEGLWVLMWVALPGLALFLDGDPTLLLGVVVLRAVNIWWMAWILRHTASVTKTVLVAALVGILAVATVHVVIGDVSGWWSQELISYWQNLIDTFNIQTSPEQAKQSLGYVVQFATGALVVTLLLLDLAIVILARGWQAKLFNPGGLHRELRQLRIHPLVSLVWLLCLGAGLAGSALALDVLPVVTLPFLLSGLSLIHNKLDSHEKIKVPALITLYLGLIVFLPYVTIVIALLGFIDSWCDFRKLRTQITPSAG